MKITEIKRGICYLIRWARRLYFYNFGRSHLKEHLKSRKGKCTSCGTCCRTAKCPLLLPANKEGKRLCSTYLNRPMWCNKDFPIDALDLKLSLKEIQENCGYYWDKKVQE